MEIGTQIGPYRIDALLGQGGMASVYKAWHTGLQCHHAMKMLPVQMTADQHFVERFLKEARTTANLHHPHIATIFNVSDDFSPQRYFVMELIEGGDLADLIHARGRVSLQEAIPILQQIASALDYAHSRGVIHRDIKPANILLQQSADGKHLIKVVDFGISKAMEEEEGARLTKTGMFVGTPEYMSPEQAGNGAMVDHHTDQYSLAVIAYEMLCGRPPFKSEGNTSMLSVIMKHVRDEPVPPSTYLPALPQFANAAILKALAKNPAERFNSCGDFVAMLRGAIGDPAVDAARTPTVIIPSTTKSTFPAVPVLLGIFIFAGVGLVGYGLMQSSGNKTDNSDSMQNMAMAPIPGESLNSTSTPKQNPVRNSPPQKISWAGEKYPQTRQRYLTFNDIQSWDSGRVRYALNEMYARRGYAFSTAFFREIFQKFSWYQPVTGRTQVAAESLMNPIEKANLQLLTKRRAALEKVIAPPPSAPNNSAMIGERFPETHTRYLSPNDISNWSYAKTRYAINEMYARYGYSFSSAKSAPIRKQFRQFSWYQPVGGRSPQQIENMMTPLEQANLKVLGARRNQLNPE